MAVFLFLSLNELYQKSEILLGRVKKKKTSQESGNWNARIDKEKGLGFIERHGEDTLIENTTGLIKFWLKIYLKIYEGTEKLKTFNLLPKLKL